MYQYKDELAKFSYWALTTLSTVGYGDLSPKSILEKIVMSVVLMIGLTVFSFLVNNMMEILDDYKAIGKTEGTDRKDLLKWIQLLSKFNEGLPIAKDLSLKIEDFFDYYWLNDRLRTLKTEADIKIINEL